MEGFQEGEGGGRCRGTRRNEGIYVNVKGKGNEAGNYKSNSSYKCITRGKGNSTAENG